VEDVRERLAALKKQAGLENWSEASNDLAHVLAHVADNDDVKILSSEILLGCGQFGRAGPTISALYRKIPGDSRVQTLRATTAYYTDQIDSALKLFRQALENDPDNKRCMKMYKMVKKLEATKKLVPSSPPTHR
jgi:tetratricopeptide (TPR) repeat protein